MSEAMLLALATFCFVSSITPGPNNMMLLASGANFGFRRTLPHLMGVSLGFGAMVLAVGLGVGGIFTAYPALYDVLRVVACAYMLWLAYRIATASGIGDRKATARPMSFSIRKPGATRRRSRFTGSSSRRRSACAVNETCLP